MNCIKGPEYLSFKRIALLSLYISLGFYLLFFMSMSLGNYFIGSSQPSRIPVGVAMSYKGFTWTRFLLNVFISFVFTFIVFLFNRWVLRRGIANKSVENTVIIAGALLVGSVASVLLTLVYKVVIFSHALKICPALMRYIAGSLVRDISITAMVIVIVQLLRSLNMQRMIAVENEMLRTKNIHARFNALKSQMNPHFLFNSLNTLHALIDTDSASAEEYVQQLSQVLRHTLQEREVITLDEEIRCARAYCQMMHIRYGDNLIFDFDINADYGQHKILPLSIQGLLENAIKHNVISSKQPLRVLIDTDTEGYVRVSNPIQTKIIVEESSGIGLANLSERYRLMWNQEIRIGNDGQIFEVFLPLIH